ncbi:mycothiol system anti-sigma-R factor [Corynebacterium halotolerans]|uniref:Anti-sigma factor n=1 Tax=Corynebacterium halotolerans YIM 70093 = DSM 44683 TaxID=1121362 RepID=M1NK32_9CORY|nr:mycothiol system anti-sigma-R factor [Corynebacterium halotolerans]AGF71773.1 Anti-sigma factor [Corynebacterium halotolerans YIM 70093 = DSM 44683]
MSMDDQAKEPCGGSCEEIQAYLCALLDDDVTPDRAEELLKRIAACPQCYGRLQSEQEIRALVRKCCTSRPAPVTLRERITMQLRVIRTN